MRRAALPTLATIMTALFCDWLKRLAKSLFSGYRPEKRYMRGGRAQ